MQRTTTAHLELINFMGNLGFPVSNITNETGVCHGVATQAALEFLQHGNLSKLNTLVNHIYTKQPHYKKDYLNNVLTRYADCVKLKQSPSPDLIVEQKNVVDIISDLEKIFIFQCSNTEINKDLFHKNLQQSDSYNTIPFFLTNKNEDGVMTESHNLITKIGAWINLYKEETFNCLFSLIPKMFQSNIALAIGGPRSSGGHAIIICYHAELNVWLLTDINQDDPTKPIDQILTKTVPITDLGAITAFIQQSYTKWTQLPLSINIYSHTKDKISAELAMNNLNKHPVFLADYNYNKEKLEYIEPARKVNLFNLATIEQDKTSMINMVAMAQSVNVDIVKMIENRGKCKNTWGDLEDYSISSLNLAITAENIELVRYLIDLGADVNQSNSHHCTEGTPLFHAISAGSLEITELLLNSGANIEKPYNEKTSLCIAVEKGELELVSFLLDKKANPNNPASISPLSLAAERGDLRMIQQLIEKGAITNHTKGKSPLFSAAGKGDLDIIQYLIDHGADISIEIINSNKSSPLIAAAIAGHCHVVKYFIETAKMKIDKKLLNDIFIKAMQYKHFDTANYLLPMTMTEESLIPSNQEKTIFIDDNKMNTLIDTCVAHNIPFQDLKQCQVSFSMKESDISKKFELTAKWLEMIPNIGDKNIFESLKALIGKVNIDLPDQRGKSALHYAIELGTLEMVTYLVEQGADINLYSTWNGGFTPMILAAHKDKWDIVNYLIKIGSTIHGERTGGETILDYALRSGKLNIVSELFAKGLDVNAKHRDGKTLLQLSNNYSQVEFLITHRADVNVKTEEGDTLLHLLNDFVEKDTSTLSLLINKGLNVNIKNRQGNTALFLAIAYNYSNVAKLLIAENADIDMENGAENYTALHMAIYRNNMEIIKLLLDKNANVFEKNNSSMSPLDMIVKCKRWDVMELLFKQKTYSKDNISLLYQALLSLFSLENQLDSLPYQENDFDTKAKIVSIIRSKKSPEEKIRELHTLEVGSRESYPKLFDSQDKFYNNYLKLKSIIDSYINVSDLAGSPLFSDNHFSSNICL